MPAGFLAGERANALSKMQPEAAVQKFLDQLDAMFGDSQQPRPASSAYVKAHIFDWAQEPYVGGAYSYPSLGAHDGDREALAAPVAGTVFFAGGHVGFGLVGGVQLLSTGPCVPAVCLCRASCKWVLPRV
jgi:monoamine oxidase